MSVVLKLEPYDPDAQDGDGDGIVQEGTAWERPAGLRLLLQSGLEVARGETSTARPQGLRSVGSDGKDVPYTPSWMRGQPTLTPVDEPKTSLSDLGARSLRESGFPDLRRMTAPPQPAPAPKPEPSKPKAKISDRDWNDFSDLDNAALSKLLNELDQQVELLLDEEDSDATSKRVKDLRRKKRAVFEESGLRLREIGKVERGLQERLAGEIWEEISAIDGQIFTFADKFGDIQNMSMNDLIQARRLLKQKKMLRADEEDQNEIGAYEILDDEIMSRAREILVKRTDLLSDTIGAGLGGKTASELQKLLRESEEIMEDASSIGPADIIGFDAIWRSNISSRQRLERRIELGVQPTKKKVNTTTLSPVFDGVTPRAVDKRRPALTEAVDGELLPVPKKFGLDESGNPKFATVEDAVKHVADGGALEDVPNEFWGDVLAANASGDIDDLNSKFYVVEGGGGIADTQIYLIRNPDGTLGNQGYVVKTASSGDNLGEMLGFNLAVAHGLNTEGAIWDGNTPRGRSVVLPHAFNLAPEGEIELPDYADYHRDLLEGVADGGMPQALAHFLHNYALGIADRHAGNGMMMRVGDQIVIVPIDQGWINQVPVVSSQFLRESPSESPGVRDMNFYAEQFSMHPSILDDVGTHAVQSNLSEEEAQKYAEKIIAVYDDILERMESVVDAGRSSWHQYAPDGLSDIDRQYYTDTANMAFSSYEQRAQFLRDSRDDILDRLLVPSAEALRELNGNSESVNDFEAVSESPIIWSGRG